MTNRRQLRLLSVPTAALAAVLALGACAQPTTEPADQTDTPRNDTPRDDYAGNAVRAVGDSFTIKTVGAPIQVEVVAAGTGEPCGRERRALVHYVGTFPDGRRFDGSRESGSPFAFRVGRGEVIDGWDLVAAQMRKGDRWNVVLPPEVAYGRRGSPPVIPPNATLHFDMEMVDFR